MFGPVWSRLMWGYTLRGEQKLIMNNSIKIMSLNVNGLNNPIKRQKVMTKLKKEKAQVIFLQETHLSKTEHDKLKRYGYRNLYLQFISQWEKKRGSNIDPKHDPIRTREGI